MPFQKAHPGDQLKVMYRMNIAHNETADEAASDSVCELTGSDSAGVLGDVNELNSSQTSAGGDTLLMARI